MVDLRLRFSTRKIHVKARNISCLAHNTSGKSPGHAGTAPRDYKSCIRPRGVLNRVILHQDHDYQVWENKSTAVMAKAA